MHAIHHAIIAGVLSLLLVATSVSAFAQTETLRTHQGTEVQLETIGDDLNHPWGMAFLPDGRLLITERNTGQLYILNSNNTLYGPVQGGPEVWTRGQGGLMDVALHPEFKVNSFVYLSYAKPGDDGKATAALGRGKLVGNRIEKFQDIFVQQPFINGSNHFGNRIAFSPDGRYLFFALGERFQFDPAQDVSNHLGTIIRIYPDGGVPEDNPFVGREDAQDEIWSYGHRNIEAMAFQPQTHALWIGEMGPKGGDELNKIVKGANYGWPVVSWGEHYNGRDIPDPPTRPEFTDAARHWTPVISPSGMVFYTGNMFPEWKNNALIGGLTHHELVRLVFDGTEVVDEDRLDLPARIRDVEVAPDGSIYLLTDQDEGKVLRISAISKK